MGLNFKANGKTFFQPSRIYGTLFVLHSKHLEELLTRLPSGVSDIVSDEVTIDTEELRTFIKLLLQIINSANNRTLAVLAGGYIAMAIDVLRMAKADAEFPGVDFPAPIRAAVEELERSPVLRSGRPRNPNQQLLNNFGQCLMTSVRTPAIHEMHKMIRGEMKGQTGRLFSELFKDFDQDKLSIIDQATELAIDTVLHKLLFTADTDRFRIMFRSTGVEYINIADASDGLAGELYTEDGWIERFS